LKFLRGDKPNVVTTMCCNRASDVDYCSVSPSGERDIIVVRDGLELQFPVISRYCGYHDNVTVTSSGNGLLVEFNSDSHREGLGFAGQYLFTRDRQSDTQTASNDERQQQTASNSQPTDTGQHTFYTVFKRWPA